MDGDNGQGDYSLGHLGLVLCRVVVSVSRRTNVSSRSRLDENCQRLGLVSVSAINVSCPRPILRQILQVTIIKLIKSVVAVNKYCKSLAELV